jgi:hypothetical protein
MSSDSGVLLCQEKNELPQDTLSRDLQLSVRDRFMTMGDQIKLLEDTNK